MVRDFIKKNADIWKNKKILCIATMGAFSGDGAGCTTRMLKRYGATILGGIHIHMPDSVCDSKLLKKTMDENRCIIAQADRKNRGSGFADYKWRLSTRRYYASFTYHRIIGTKALVL